MKTTRFRWSRAALLVAPVALAAATLAAWSASPPASPADPPRTPPAAQELSPYAADPNDLWNRLHRLLFLEAAPPGSIYHQSDPLLFTTKDYLASEVSLAAFSTPEAHQRALTLYNETKDYLLTPEVYRKALALLDEFLADPRAQAGHQPFHRLFFQHDLWAAFDYIAWRPDNWVHFEKDEPAAIALRTRLAKAIGILALSDRELAALPDNYAQAVKAGRFPKAFDPAKPDRPFLPDDLFDPRGPWVAFDHYLDIPLVKVHYDGCGGRAVHVILLNLPGGRAVTEKYLEDLKASDIKNFPNGTMVALVRRNLTIDQHGSPRLTPITESVQFRVFLDVPDMPSEGFPHNQRGGRQAFFEFTLDRSELARGNDGLRAVTPEEPRFVFSRTVQGRSPTQMSTCNECHDESGIYSMRSIMQNLSSSLRQTKYHAFSWDVLTKNSTIAKTRTFEWGLLQGMLEIQNAGR